MLFSTNKTIKKSSTGDDDRRRRHYKSKSSMISLNKSSTIREVESDSGSTASSSSIDNDDDVHLGSTNEYCPPLSLKPTKQKYEIAIIAMGNFWNPQRRITKMNEQPKYNNGIKRVIAGYCILVEHILHQHLTTFRIIQWHYLLNIILKK